MHIVTYYEIVLSTYHDTVVGRLRYGRPDGSIDETMLYTPDELNNILSLWREGALLGSFGIGSILADNVNFQLVES